MMSDLIQLKRKTSSLWLSTNPILKSGEPGVEKDTFKLKIGDGVTAWNLLPYSSGGTNSSSVWYANSGAPRDDTGVENDLYLNTINGDIYQRGILSWGTSIANIMGIKGDPGEDWIPQKGTGTLDILNWQPLAGSLFSYYNDFILSSADANIGAIVSWEKEHIAIAQAAGMLAGDTINGAIRFYSIMRPTISVDFTYVLV